jgi:phosphate transport system substrate-binding protein
VRTGRLATLAGGIAVATVTVAACTSSNNNVGTTSSSSSSSPSAASACASGTLSGAGSTFQQPMEEQWISGYTGQCTGARIDYTGNGSGAGVTLFSSGNVAFAGDDVPLGTKDRPGANARCKSLALDIPVTAGGVAVTYNLPSVTTTLKFSADTIADIFTGKVTRWNAAQIAADNPGVTLPNMHISVYYRSDASGTTAVFSGFLNAASPVWKASGLGSGKHIAWPVGQGAQKSAGVSAGVKSTPGGITYVEQNYAQQHTLPTAEVKNAGGSYVTLTSAHVSAALSALTAKPAGSGDLTQMLNFLPTGADAYPISTVSYAIVCAKYPSSVGMGTVDLLKDYLTYAVTTGQSSAVSLGFAPLPSALVSADQSAITSIS